MEGSTPIQLENVNHAFEEGGARKQILFDITVEIRPGEIVILTGPSGSGKTTVLTLIGALRTVQEGSVAVLGRQLRGASGADRVGVRRQIGYIFQQHNLLESLTADQNVQMALALQGGHSSRVMRERSVAMLESVGLGNRVNHYPGQLSGGQKQRVAIARALVNEPKMILADEPTASLDKQSGRDVVELMQKLAKEQGVTVILVTHDNRILDVADRILHLEDGRLSSFTQAVLANTQHMMDMLAQQNRKGEFSRRVLEMPSDQFGTLLERVTADAQNFLWGSEMAANHAFESMLEQVLDAFTFKIGEILNADRASLFLLDESRAEIWSKVARDAGGELFEIRIPSGAGIAGAVVASGETLNIPDAYADPRFNRSVDDSTGYRTRSILCVPLKDKRGKTFGAAQLLNRHDEQPFDHADERRFQEFMDSMSVILESWWRMSEGDRTSLSRRSPAASS